MGAVRAVCAACEWGVPPVSGRIALCICGKGKRKTRYPLDGVAPWRQASEISTRWGVLGPVVQAHLQTWGGVGSRKSNTEVGQLQNCSASVGCAKKLGDNCIVGAIFGKEKETPLALVLLYITYSWVLLILVGTTMLLIISQIPRRRGKNTTTTTRRFAATNTNKHFGVHALASYIYI